VRDFLGVAGAAGLTTALTSAWQNWQVCAQSGKVALHFGQVITHVF
jgi:hypothetical protein